MIIFKLGFIPKDNDFRELSADDYLEFHNEGGETEGKMFRFVDGKYVANVMPSPFSMGSKYGQ